MSGVRDLEHILKLLLSSPSLRFLAFSDFEFEAPVLARFLHSVNYSLLLLVVCEVGSKNFHYIRFPTKAKRERKIGEKFMYLGIL